MRLPVRTRITLAFAAALAVVLAALAAFVYVRTGAYLLENVDAGLRSRGDVLAAEIRAHGADVPDVESVLIERDEAFAQVADRTGAVLRSSRIVARAPLLGPDAIGRIDRAGFFDRRIPGIDDVTRILALPVEHEGRTFVLMVASSLQDRRDQLLQLGWTLALGSLVALGLITYGGWLLVGASLRPVERMRAEAAAVSALEPGRRLAVPPGTDEFASLASTLNEMLERLANAFERQRRFVDDASHELRTPVGVLRARIELALSRPRSRDELEEALRRALGEAERLSRLADDLLVLSRSRDGRVPIHREPVRLAELLEAAAAAHRPAAEAERVRIEVDAGDVATALDPLRLRQVVDNLLDNAIRHAGPNGRVRISAAALDGEVRIAVEDSGTGFDRDLLPIAFEPFTRGSAEDGAPGAGLGLAIVKAVAEAHGGGAEAENLPGAGARVTVRLRTR